jgi:hypothetical protein
MIDIASPLSAIYSTSTMESHHFAMAVSILQQEHNNILASLQPDEYKAVSYCLPTVLLSHSYRAAQRTGTALCLGQLVLTQLAPEKCRGGAPNAL